MSIVLVTGGAGFIGSHLVEALVAQGRRVRVLDNFSTGSPVNLAAVRDRIELIEGDITEAAVVTAVMRGGVELVYHQAALASVPRSIAHPMPTHRACVDGTLNVLNAARETGVRRVVYAASSSAYGNNPTLPRRETDATAPLSPYAVAKLAAELYCSAYAEVYGLETVRLRYFNVFGPRQSPDSAYAAVIPVFLQSLARGQRPRINGDGHQSRDFTYVGDVVRANLLAGEAPGVSGQVYNIARGERTSLLQLVGYLNDLLGTDLAAEHGPDRPGDVRHSLADITAARADLEYEPAVDMLEGLRRTVAWWQSTRGRKTPMRALAG